MKSLFNNLIVRILSFLLHHANLLGKDNHFYKIKNKILAKYGKHICYDVQFIEGKKCNSCGGTGIFRSGWKLPQTCWNCYGDGWYKKPCWNILAKISFGPYEFYQPYLRVFKDPEPKTPLIQGYIEHDKSKYSKLAMFILFLLYEKGYLKRWYLETGIGWRSYWWLPRNYLYNAVHIIKHGRNSIPFKYKGVIRMKISKLFKPQQAPVYYPQFENDDLPF